MKPRLQITAPTTSSPLASAFLSLTPLQRFRSQHSSLKKMESIDDLKARFFAVYKSLNHLSKGLLQQALSYMAVLYQNDALRAPTTEIDDLIHGWAAHSAGESANGRPAFQNWCHESPEGHALMMDCKKTAQKEREQAGIADKQILTADTVNRWLLDCPEELRRMMESLDGPDGWYDEEITSEHEAVEGAAGKEAEGSKGAAETREKREESELGRDKTKRAEKASTAYNQQQLEAKEKNELCEICSELGVTGYKRADEQRLVAEICQKQSDSGQEEEDKEESEEEDEEDDEGGLLDARIAAMEQELETLKKQRQEAKK
ncbi:uncharacterized protein J3D65DRAFT_694486 [Phyllosticta citribraziliensis]|uniref:Uncharacterized protein n=1 Tax=Phyllosticta citribraziliensis TaxID=989973 RepID=A0ABR1LSZ2_9PEZI